MRPPREQGANDFAGMDTSLSRPAPVYEKATLDVGSDHSKQGAWRSRRGYQRAYAKVTGSVNLVLAFEAEDETTAVLVSTGSALYYAETPASPARGTGSYGDTVYGD